jgi:hypothetical protein
LTESQSQLLTTKTGTKRDIRRLKEALDYVSEIPNMFRQHVGHVFSKYEINFIRESQDPVKRRESVLKMDETTESYSGLDSNIGFEGGSNIKNIEVFYKSLKKKIDDYLVTNNVNTEDDITNTLLVANNLIEEKRRLDLLSLCKSQITLLKEDVKQKLERDGQTHQNKERLEDMLNKLNLFYSELVTKTQTETNEVNESIRILVDPPPLHPIQNTVPENRYNLKKNGLISTHSMDYTNHLVNKANEILGVEESSAISAASILYACMGKNSQNNGFSLYSPLKTDSFNVIYAIIKIMESAGTTGDINERPLDTGSGLTGNVLLNAGTDYFKTLLDDSISTHNSAFWDTFPSITFSLGLMDSLISDQ